MESMKEETYFRARLRLRLLVHHFFEVQSTLLMFILQEAQNDEYSEQTTFCRYVLWGYRFWGGCYDRDGSECFRAIKDDTGTVSILGESNAVVAEDQSTAVTCCLIVLMLKVRWWRQERVCVPFRIWKKRCWVYVSRKKNKRYWFTCAAICSAFTSLHVPTMFKIFLNDRPDSLFSATGKEVDSPTCLSRRYI